MKQPRIFTVFLAALVFLLASAIGARAAEVKIDSAVRYQTIDGFGTCTYLYSAKDLAAYQTKAFDDLYVGDLGASLIRMEIHPDAEPQPDLDLDHLNLDKLNMNSKFVAPLGKAFAQMQKLYPGKVRVFASLWSPPGWMKDNGGPTHGGHLRSDRVQELGKYIAGFCIDFEKTYGVHIYAVSLQNELAFSEFYNSCIYTPDTFRDAIAAVGAQFKKWGVTTKLMGPEDVGAGSDYLVQRELGFIRAAESDPAADAALDLFNVHGYADKTTTSSGGTTSSWATLRDQTQQYSKRLWQTETSGEKPTWPAALHVALDLHEALAYGDCSAWAYWQGYDASAGGNPYSLFSKLEPTEKKYCVAKQYFKYIRPGGVRVMATGDTATFYASAYVDDSDKTLTVVLLNMGNNAEPVHLMFPNYPQLQKMQAWRTDADDSFAAQPDVVNGNGSADITIPPQSVVTLYGTGIGEAPTKPTVPTNLLASPLNEAVSLTWTAGWHADSYVVERATAGSGAYHPVASGIKATHYLDAGLTDGQQYYYKVSGTSAEGSSPDSAPATATPLAVGAAFAPTPPKMDDQIGLEWAAAKWYSLDHIVRGDASVPYAVTGRFKVMWDADNLYALMETTAPAVAEAGGTPTAGDGWEIYVDSTGQRPSNYTGSDYHFVLPFGAVKVREAAHGEDSGGTCISFKTTTGYVIKAKIPLAAVGVAACDGEIFGIDFNVAAHVGRQPPFKRAWWATTDFDWENPSLFGAARLSGAAGTPLAQAPAIVATPGNSSVTLSWQPVSGAGGYRVERGLAGAPMAAIATVAAPSSAPVKYVELGVDEQDTWQYAVIPYSAAGLGKESPPVSVKPLVEVAPPGSVMIHCGGGAVGRFDADKDFTGGGVAANYLGPIVRDVVDPAPAAVYQTERNGKFSYSIPDLKPGQPYLLRLHFCENYWTAPGKRAFSVFVNGKELLHDFDVFKEAHGDHTAVIRESAFTAPADGKLDLTFTAKTNMPIIQAIEVIPR